MTADPVEPRKPREPREPRTGADPFERAAKREEKEELKREAKRASLMKKMQRGSRSSVAALALPYIVLGLVKAAYYDFGEPTLPRSIVRFFFHGGWFWTGYTFVLMLVIWAWAMGEDVVNIQIGDD
jgi:hypothetical protein